MTHVCPPSFPSLSRNAFSQEEFKGRTLYKAGSSCSQCHSQPCPKGFFRRECQAGRGAACEPCTNAIPGGAKYTSEGIPSTSNFCAWSCAGIYERRGDGCVVSTLSFIVVGVAAGGLSVLCICVSSYNSAIRIVNVRRQTQPGGRGSFPVS